VKKPRNQAYGKFKSIPWNFVNISILFN